MPKPPLLDLLHHLAACEDGRVARWARDLLGPDALTCGSADERPRPWPDHALLRVPSSTSQNPVTTP